MFFIKVLSSWFLFSLLNCSPQINLYTTDWVSDNEIDVVFEHDCLHIAALIEKETTPYQIISYCLTDWPSKWNIQENDLDQKFTFDQLYKQNITSQQLYFWSAPVDIVERYQLYLNKLSSLKDLASMGSQMFYNCASPRFGPLCQYSLDIDHSDHSSLNEIIYEFYQEEYLPVALTCYIHLKCDRGSVLTCLDWSEVCDGYIDCVNDGLDEQNCWQLEINECEENEYRCDNGQCIAKIFSHDDLDVYECLDRSDEIRDMTRPSQSFNNEPTFAKEDMACPLRYYEFQTKLTSSCVPKRDKLLMEMMFLDTPNSLSDICWLAFKYNYGIERSFDPECRHLGINKTCKQIINETCPNLLSLPAGPLAFGHMYLLYLKETLMSLGILPKPQYICYNDQLCGGFYPNRTLLTINNKTCRRLEDFPVSFQSAGRRSLIDTFITPFYTEFYHCNSIAYSNIAVCNSSAMYQCINSSKCISKYRLCDGKNDCDYKDDEYCPLINDTCSKLQSDMLFKCITNNKCISLKMVGNGKCDCLTDEYGLCDDEYSNLHSIRKHLSFPTICDGFTELIPFNIDGRNETDETECQYWQCNNTYTRCDGFWNCFDGADEVDCDSSPLFKCPSHHHICVSPDTYQLMCLPLKRANDGNIDCLGATDEPKLCRANNYQLEYQNFHCKNDTIRPCISSRNLCYEEGKCAHGDDTAVCNRTQNNNTRYSICADMYTSIRTNAQTFLCRRVTDIEKPLVVYFSLDKLEQSGKQLTIPQRKMHSTISPPTFLYDQRCHRGLPLRVWLNNSENSTAISCLCPPSFYGNMCQYQNQRVSLTIRLQALSDSRRTLFAIVISLIDNSEERIIHSYQQITYLYIEHCRTKYNIYLLYSNRPKLATKNYSIHIDIYEKISFVYRGSLLIPLKFSFLPVHRIAVQLNIPRTTDTLESYSDRKCIYGRCVKYSNDSKETSFCQCDPGWSGKHCTIPHICICSSDSLCLGVSANNRSICICPLNKWGSLCLLESILCQSDQNATCQNGGECVAIDENMVSNKKFLCICPKGFSGERCERVDNQIIVSFDKDIILPQSMLIHFIRVIDNGPPENGSTFKTIPINQKLITIRWSRPYHIAFIQLFNTSFYLITVQKTHNQSMVLSKTINQSDRCEHLSEVLNKTIVNLHLLRRIKYYHIPCQRLSPLLSCFYDDTHFCLCDYFGHQRVANCFEFNSSIKHDCFGQSNCENGAQCLQDKPTCPQTSMCVCPKCFYGTRCQFSSSLFGLSLDAILGYHIQPRIYMNHQPHIVQVSVALATIIIVVGLTNGILSLITFKNKETQKVGCGLYLLGSAITTLLTVIMFTVKFSILIITQMSYTTNRTFLSVQCYSIDFLLYICLIIDQWLSACVAMERAFTVIKGANFNKAKSRQIAKYIIFIVILLTIATTIHDPIHRHLLYDNNDDDEKHIWCIITYPSHLHTYDTFIRIFHFFASFIINIIAAFIIIIMTVRQRAHLENHQSYQDVLRRQFRQHGHLLIAPILLVILALPRLIISFVSDCMNSMKDSWLFLIGYFVSFIPSMLCFVVFVLPSKSYKKEFRKTIRRYRKTIRTRFYTN